jgi:nicotinamidase-related amidase
MSRLLIVVDMQNDFVDGALGTDEAKAIVPRVIDKVKNHKGTVIYTRDTHDQGYISTQEGRNLPVTHCVESTLGWEIIDELKKLALENSSIVFNKDTFGSKDLINHLVELEKSEPIEEIQIVGLCTDICVISNALAIKTYLPEVPIVVDAKCCAGVSPESHEIAIKAMKTCQVSILV